MPFPDIHAMKHMKPMFLIDDEALEYRACSLIGWDDEMKIIVPEWVNAGAPVQVMRSSISNPYRLLPLQHATVLLLQAQG
jgi:hypothetical protein